MKYLKKILIVFILCVPCFIYGSTQYAWSDAITIARKIYKADKYSYFIKSSEDISILDIDDLVKSERLYDGVHNLESKYLYSSYIVKGSDFWVSDNDNKSLFGKDKAPVRATANVEPGAVVVGTGSMSSPWIFSNYYTVTLDANGGYFDSGNYSLDDQMCSCGKSICTCYVPKGGNDEVTTFTFPDSISPKKDNYEFKGWSTKNHENNNSSLILENSTEPLEKNNSKYFAQWSVDLCAVDDVEPVDYVRNNLKILNVYATRNLLSSWLKTQLSDFFELSDSSVKECPTKNHKKSGWNAGYINDLEYATFKNKIGGYDNKTFKLDSVHIADFNKSPSSYLGEDGNWKYDLVIFGFADCNGKFDLSNAAKDAIVDYIKGSYPVILGHDAFLGSQSALGSNYCEQGNAGHPNFNELTAFFNINIDPESKENNAEIESTHIPDDVKNCKVIYNKPCDLDLESSADSLVIIKSHATTGLSNNTNDFNFMFWLEDRETTLPFIYSYFGFTENIPTFVSYVGSGHAENPGSPKGISLEPTLTEIPPYKPKPDNYELNYVAGIVTKHEAMAIVNLIFYMDYMSYSSRIAN